MQLLHLEAELLHLQIGLQGREEGGGGGRPGRGRGRGLRPAGELVGMVLGVVGVPPTPRRGWMGGMGRLLLLAPPTAGTHPDLMG